MVLPDLPEDQPLTSLKGNDMDNDTIRVRPVDVLNLVDLMNMAAEEPIFCSMDHVSELASDWGDPFDVLARKEAEQGGPAALCSDSTY